MALEEMGIEVKGAAATIRGFTEFLHGINTEESLDDLVSEELYIAACEIFSKTVKEMLRYKVFLLWSEPDYVTVQILDSDKECKMWIKDAECLFKEHPIPNSGDPKMDEFERRNRFAREITFEQFLELAGDEFENPHSYSISETGLEFVFEDRLPVVEARAAGKL